MRIWTPLTTWHLHKVALSRFAMSGVNASKPLPVVFGRNPAVTVQCNMPIARLFILVRNQVSSCIELLGEALHQAFLQQLSQIVCDSLYSRPAGLQLEYNCCQLGALRMAALSHHIDR